MCCLTLYPCISHLKYGGIFGDDFITDLLRSLVSKDFRKWFSIWQGQGQEYNDTIFDFQWTSSSCQPVRVRELWMASDKFSQMFGKE